MCLVRILSPLAGLPLRPPLVDLRRQRGHRAHGQLREGGFVVRQRDGLLHSRLGPRELHGGLARRPVIRHGRLSQLGSIQ